MNEDTDVCFVVMPFGVKSLPDRPDQKYDFDKVYRVMIRRAIKEAGMRPHRADEGTGSGLIHSDMFRDLRDRPVVLADLSLENPNVFYELGMRHVMADSGTTLICREGAELPFDVGLSRVVFYKYDGSSLDWEEVERIVPILAAALQEARRGTPDSPVHALLPGTVLRSVGVQQRHARSSIGATESDELEAYERDIAERWLASGTNLEELYDQNKSTVFGTRALGRLCLLGSNMPSISHTIAARLSDQEQYRLANQVFTKLRASSIATWKDNLRFATSYSEAHPNLAGADAALCYAKEALDMIRTAYPPDEMTQGDIDADVAYGDALGRISSLLRWRYQLTEDIEDLEQAVNICEESLAHLRRARRAGGMAQPGRLAQTHLVNLLLLRIRDENNLRPDQERHQQAILDIKEMMGDEPIEVSWLHWYQALALADAGDKNAAMQMAQKTIAQDAQVRSNPDYWEVGRRQYALLRRFIEQYGPHFREPSIVGIVSQAIQSVSDNSQSA